MKQKLRHWTLILFIGSIFWFGWQNEVEAMQRGFGEGLSPWVSREVYMTRGVPHERHSTLWVQNPFATLDGAYKLPTASQQPAVQQRLEPHVAIAQSSSAHNRHVLERLSFGITSEQMQQVENVGIEAYIQDQLNPELVPESSALNDYLKQLDSIDRKPSQMYKQDMALGKQLNNLQLSQEQRTKVNEERTDLRRQIINEAVYSHLARAIYSNRQLQEVMVDFWFNHFNVYVDKGPTRFWINDYENQIRNNAFGSFRDLLAVTAKHPAMLVYLDNKFNVAPNSPKGLKTKKGLNENYARELMELHTLGVDGGYTQDDVIVLARILTGWGVNFYNKKENQQGFVFDKNSHDFQDKVFLGHQISASGIEEGEKALDILASHPATARNISYKLAQYFVADKPPSSLVDLLTQKFLDSKGDIKVVLNTLIHSSEFNSPQYYKQKFKTPYQYLISLVRIAQIETADIKRMQGMFTQLSMPVYKCLSPTGYKNTRSAWLNPQAMLQRISFATAIARGSLNKDYPIELQQLKTNLGETSQHTKQVIAKNPKKLNSALIMGSPEAMYR